MCFFFPFTPSRYKLTYNSKNFFCPGLTLSRGIVRLIVIDFMLDNFMVPAFFFW
uniref:Uncharacterized protein n=1 Tax=Arundo donax TaxID=35708 RepID=A0A0A8ZGR2_ARUDO